MKPRILVIDDEAAIRDSLKMILEYEGYEVLTAATGEDGIAQAEREAPDLIFLDVKMPGHGRARGPAAAAAHRRSHADRRDLRPRHGVDGGRSDQARRVRFHREAARARARAGHGAQRRRFAAAAHREPVVQARRGEAVSDRRRLAAPGARARVDRQGGADQRHRAHLGRERRRQGAGGAGDSPREPASRRPVRAGQLRRHSRTS